MRAYKPTPTWWYAVSLVFLFALSIVFVEYFDTGLPWWGVVVALLINLVALPPIAIMSALCNQSVSLNVLSALIGGTIWPGKLVAVAVFKILTFNTAAMAVVLLRDQKLGHYMKIPPRVVFTAQAVGIIISWLSQTAVNTWALGNIPNVCEVVGTNAVSPHLLSNSNRQY
jgi:OPT family oligopeptide transporter